MSFQYNNIYFIILVLTLIFTFLGLFYFWHKKNNPPLSLHLKMFSLILTIILTLFALLNPQGNLDNNTTQAKGVDIVFALDVSKSMNTYDLKIDNTLYSRLQASKILINNFITKHLNNRFGLIVFAEDTTSITPLTFDQNIFLTFLNGVNWQNVTKQGTNLNSAIDLASQRFNNEERSKVIVLISDGGDKESVDFSQIKKILNKKNITLITVGVGTSQGGKIVEGNDVWGNVIYKTYQGQVVISVLNEKNLKKIAQQNNGQYLALQNFNDLNKIETKLNKLDQKALKKNIGSKKQSLIRYFSFLAGFCWLGYLFFWFKRASN